MNAAASTNLNPTEGHILAGVQIDEHRFLARVKAPQLFQIAPDPRDSEDKRKLAASKEAQDMRAIREAVQRLFEGAKAKNVGAYAEYIAAVHSGRPGITPAIILYSEERLDTALDGQFGHGAVLIPWGKKLVAIDGETQLAARYEAANRHPETQADYVAVHVCHGLPKSWARQAFHDLNVLAIRPNSAISVGMDARDPLTAITREVEARVPFFTDRVNKTRRQLRSTDTDVTTITGLRGACATVADGIGGVKHGTRPVRLAGERQALVQEAAVDWWRAVTDVVGSAIEDRENQIACAPAVLAAIGAMGHALVSEDDPERRRQVLARQVAKLRSIDWRRERHWDGIAGKLSPKGQLTVAGSKETAYAIFAALNDEGSPAFARVRRTGV